MSKIMRKAGVLWTGDLKGGKGLISTESQVMIEQPYGYATRFEDEQGTNPEELIAAAHAACFCMAFANLLKKKGYSPEKISANATCYLSPKDGGGFEISRMDLHVRGQVQDIDEANFKRIGAEADKECPVSNLLRSGLDIHLDTELVEAFVAVP